MRERELILDLFEMASGARLLYNYIWIGGLAHDLPAGWVEKPTNFWMSLIFTLKNTIVF